jgi:alpha-1,3-rhamnosyl/mannosyltransferase
VRIAFDSRPAKDRLGVGRYARCLLEALRESGRGEIVETHDPRRGDLFHSPWLDGSLLRSPVPTVVTLHDAVPLKRRGEYLRFGLRFKLRYLAVERSTRVIVSTRAVADDLMAQLGISAGRIEVVPEAAATVFSPRPETEVQVVRERYRLPERYLLWVGGLRTPDPRKRLTALARTRRTLPLVLVGEATRWARELPDVQLTGAVDDDELAAIYTGAHALVFPNQHEGFGLPPVEALACGTPVAACDVPALREVLDGRVMLAGKDDLEQLVRRAEGLTRPAPAPPQWTWRDAAAATWQVYADALSAPAPGRRRRASHSADQAPRSSTGSAPRSAQARRPA